MFWKGGVFKVTCVSSLQFLFTQVVQDTSQLMGPLVKVLINFAKGHAAAKAAGMEPANIGHGIGMVFGLLTVIVLASICQHQFFFRSMITGVLARTTLTGALYRRAVHLTPLRASACPTTSTVCLIILLVELGPSVLAGFALFLIITLQERIMAHQFSLRRGSMEGTDERAGRVLKVVASMRVVKYFCYEGSFLARLFRIRTQELRGIRKIQHSQSANIALAFSLPVLAATLAFVAYTKTSKQFDVAVVFASFSLFQLVCQPMMFLPCALSAIADARNALAHLSLVFRAPLHEGAPVGVGAAVPPEDEPKEKGKGKDGEKEKEKNKKGKGGRKEKKKNENEEEHSPEPEPEQPPFALHDITLSIPRGTLAAVVGRVGSGKSSLLQGLIGEMRTTGAIGVDPECDFEGQRTLRAAVRGGQVLARHRGFVFAPGFVAPRGWGLDGGGQKQRVNIARALYYGADVVIFDDPLPAVDANVGKALFHSAIQGLVAQDKTVLLVTHALHFLAQCDYIYTLDGGRIAEAGTYPELIARGGEFARLDREFRGAKAEDAGGEGAGEDGDEDEAQVQVVSVEDAKARSRGAAGTGKIKGKLIVKERRTTGGVAWSVYGYYAKAGGGWPTVPAIVLVAVLMQGSQVANLYVLVWWQGNTFDKPFSFYQILYALLGISQATCTYLPGLFMDFFAVRVSKNLHHQAIVNIFHAPMSFFDTTPMGRIISIFGKDIDTIDNALPMSMRMFILVLAQVLSSVIVITVLEHYFIVAAVLIIFGFSYFLQFYRASALEMKRLDSMLRSILYAHLSESLTGLPTIPASAPLLINLYRNFLCLIFNPVRNFAIVKGD
ncbi:hypothetical protein B0H13DRAFT_2444703 [Mycena leptocephala]|nr:hypothetical protein B0H13DRAFT_2444703 [Mycena leptocephala]